MIPWRSGKEILVHDFEQIVNDPEVKIVVEVMGGTVLPILLQKST